MELKKTYKGFVLWMLGFFLVIFGVAFLPIEDGILMGRIVNNICSVGVTLLAYIIYKTEYVYWYNGTEYEEAVKAGSERRKEFAWKHFRRFGLFSVTFLIFSVISQLSQFNFGIDIVVLLTGIVAVAISTIQFKL